jgi:hypothetical protein
MRFIRLSVLTLGLAVAGTAAAQTPHPDCVGAGSAGNACQVAVDLFGYMNPQLGMLIAGGNATLGQGGALGGLGKFAVTIRANATQELSVPDIQSLDLSGPVSQNSYSTTSQMGGFPAFDAAVGIWGGFPLGLTRVGGVDAIVNVFYVPGSIVGALDGDGYAFGLPDGGTRIGYGARIGILSESILIPGVSFTYLQRDLPKVSFTGATSSMEPDTVSVSGLDVRTSAWRLVAGKKLGPVAVALGYGQDRYSSSATLGWAVQEGIVSSSGSLPVEQNVTRTNMFADLSLNVFLFRLVGEVGRVSGGDISTYNSFDQAPDKARTYGAIGLRFGN